MSTLGSTSWGGYGGKETEVWRRKFLWRSLWAQELRDAVQLGLGLLGSFLAMSQTLRCRRWGATGPSKQRGRGGQSGLWRPAMCGV